MDDFSNLVKADVYSLGVRWVACDSVGVPSRGQASRPLVASPCMLDSILELALGSRLPTTGVEWENLRCDRIPQLPRMSQELNDIVRLMMKVGCGSCLFCPLPHPWTFALGVATVCVIASLFRMPRPTTTNAPRRSSCCSCRTFPYRWTSSCTTSATAATFTVRNLQPL